MGWIESSRYQGPLNHPSAEPPDLAQREEALPVVLAAEIRRDSVRGEQIHHFAHRDACELGRPAQRGLVGNAMARNKYIYCLADAGVVVTTSKESGGTWAGAIENLKHGWVPLWVKENGDPDSGNAALVQRGAQWLPESDLAVSSLVSQEQAQ